VVKRYVAAGLASLKAWVPAPRRHSFYDNAWHHTASWACDSLRYSGWEAVDRTLYSPDPALLSFPIFGPSNSTWLAASDFQQTPTEASCHLLVTNVTPITSAPEINLGVTVGKNFSVTGDYMEV